MVEPMLDAPIPGMALTHEVGARPWQKPSQYNTVEEALDYYIPRLQSDEVSSQLIDVLEMGIPVTTIANIMQLSSVMEGKHNIDVGMLVMPVLVELIMLIGDTAGVDYSSGLEKGKDIRGSLVDKAVRKFTDSESSEKEIEAEDEPELKDEQVGLMARRDK